MTSPWNVVGWLIVAALSVALVALPIAVTLAARTRRRAEADFMERRKAQDAVLADRWAALEAPHLRGRA